MNIQEILSASLGTGFIDHLIDSEKVYRPELLTNDTSQGRKVLTTILRELQTCDEFWFSVAFVTTGGLATLMGTLVELEKRNIKGKILASQYLNFTDPEALRRLKQFDNIELRIATEGDFHSKGYLFKRNGLYDLIIGSSNLTEKALCSNKEWNLKISATDESELINQAVQEFQKEFAAAQEVTKQYLETYKFKWRTEREFRRRISQLRQNHEESKVTPNEMQKEALANLENLRSKGQNKALLISATGTGKTYLSAFDVQKTKPRKFLFVVHRLTIAQKAKETFENLLGDKVKMGVFSGSTRELDADYLFCTVQTLAKQEYLELFDSSYFDYIVIDETHRASADSYKRLMDYFNPKFLLGMTATPERTDGTDVFKLFDYNIAYEIRLHQALAEEMLVPFHYYGITDLTVGDEEVSDMTEFNMLFADERVDHIIQKAELYGCDDGEVRGLVFCSKNEIALELSSAFNEKGYVTTALSGSSSESERKEAIRRLESARKPEKLDYIFTVDIFNEGIDIPKVNQIIMLRPTQSAIIFVQQLGRGLRKTDGKEYLTVIDFIGNYTNNYLLPIALYGDNTYNKDTLRKLLSSGSSLLPGSSTIDFDQISKERIFEALNNVNMSKLADLKKDYFYLKNKLGRIPMMMDFLKYGSRDPWLFVKHSTFKSYLNFINKVEDDFRSDLNKTDLELLQLFYVEINNGKRLEESLILKSLLEDGYTTVSGLKKLVEEQFGYLVSDETIDSCITNLNFEFIKKPKGVVVREADKIRVGTDLEKALLSPTFELFLKDSTLYSIESFTKLFDLQKFVNGFVRYEKYSRKDVCRILNWSKDISSTVYGYRTNNDITPCFVTYHKSDAISESTSYNDHFISQELFAWESRSRRKVKSKEIVDVIESDRVLLFVKKEDGEGTDFYYLGDCSIVDGSIKQETMPNSEIPVVHFTFKLDKPVNDQLYDYIIS